MHSTISQGSTKLLWCCDVSTSWLCVQPIWFNTTMMSLLYCSGPSTAIRSRLLVLPLALECASMKLTHVIDGTCSSIRLKLNYSEYENAAFAILSTKFVNRWTKSDRISDPFDIGAKIYNDLQPMGVFTLRCTKICSDVSKFLELYVFVISKSSFKK